MIDKFIESNSLWDKAWMALKDRDYPLFDEVMERFWAIAPQRSGLLRTQPASRFSPSGSLPLSQEGEVR